MTADFGKVSGIDIFHSEKTRRRAVFCCVSPQCMPHELRLIKTARQISKAVTVILPSVKSFRCFLPCIDYRWENVPVNSVPLVENHISIQTVMTTFGKRFLLIMIFLKSMMQTDFIRLILFLFHFVCICVNCICVRRTGYEYPVTGNKTQTTAVVYIFRVFKIIA